MVAAGKYKFDAWAVPKWAELLGKRLKMFADKADGHDKNARPIEQKVDSTIAPAEMYLKMIGK